MRHRTTVLILSLATSTLAFGLFWRAFAAETNYTKYQMEFRYVTLDEAKSVIVRTIGSGALNLAYGEELLKGTRSSVLGASADWFNEHPDATISGAVPFYGPRNLPVAYEYYIQCGDKICGALYDVFPDITNMDDAMNLFRKGSKCLAAYDCGSGSNIPGLSLRTFFVPNAVPASIRLAASVPEGRVKFYHGIYAIGEKDRKVVSLDPRDEGITGKQLKQRLFGLIDFSTYSPSIPLIYERTRTREFYSPSPAGSNATPLSVDDSRKTEKPYACTPVGPETTRTIRIPNGDGTFHNETITSRARPPGSLYKPDCVGLSLSEPLIYGNYTFISRGIDYLTGRVGNDLYQMKSYLDGAGL